MSLFICTTVVCEDAYTTKAVFDFQNNKGPVVQSIVSLTSSLVAKLLTVLVSTISNSQVFLQMQKLLTFFQ